MNARTLKALTSVVIVLVLLLVLIEYRDSEHTASTGERLFPDIRQQIENISSIEINSASFDQPVTLERRDNRWSVSNRNDYPADMAKIRELLQSLADARIVEVKTSNPDLHHRLGLRAPDVDGSNGTLVTLTGDDTRFGVIIGNLARGNQRYVREQSTDQTWLIDQNPTLPATAIEWLSTELVDIDSDEVASVSISHDEGDEIVISRAADDGGDLEVSNLPQGRELSYATVANNIAGALTGLSFEDLQSAISTERSAQTVFELKDGMRLVVTSFAAESGNWISLQAATSETADETASASAADINSRVEGWHYQVADHKFNLLNRQWTDILKEPAAGEEDGPADQ